MSKRRKSNQASLKTMLVIGSILATFIGGDLLANRPISPVSPPAIVHVTSENSAEIKSTNTTLPDSPIPKLVIPKPITKSKSSK